MPHRDGQSHAHEGKKAHKEQTTESLKLFGFEIGHWPALQQFTVCVIGFFVFKISHGYFQEFIFKIEGFNFGVYLTLFELVFYILFAWIEITATKFQHAKSHKKSEDIFDSSGNSNGSKSNGGHNNNKHNINSSTKPIPLIYYFLLSMFLMIGQSLGNSSLQYLNYPTKVIFRSSKLIPVMIVGVVFLKQKFTSSEYLSSFLMSLGLVLFTLADQAVIPEFNFYGLFLVISSIMFESVFSNFQQKILQQWRGSQQEMVLYSNAFGTLQLIVLLAISGELFTATQFCYNNPHALIAMIAESTLGYIGVYFYLGLVKRFGAVVAVFVACMRSVVTIMISFIIFPKPWTMQYAVAAFMVFAAMILNAYGKHNTRDTTKLYNKFVKSPAYRV